MAGTATIEPPAPVRPIRRFPLVVLVGPGIDGADLARSLDGHGTPVAQTLHVVAVEGAIPLWRAMVDHDQFLAAGTWDLYQECVRHQEQRRAERRADLEHALTRLLVPITVECHDGPLRAALNQSTRRWPRSTILVAGPWRRLPPRWPAWPDQVQLFAL